MNTSPDAATIYDGIEIATAEPVDCVTAPVNTVGEKSGDCNNYTTGNTMSTDQLKQLVNKLGSEISEEEREVISELLFLYADIFASSPTDMGRTDRLRHNIYTGEALPFRQQVREVVQKLLKNISCWQKE